MFFYFENWFLKKKYFIFAEQKIKIRKFSKMSFSDLRNGGLMTWFREQDPEKKEKLKEAFFKETVHGYLENFEKHLKSNNGGKEFFVGSGPTWADFGIAVMTSQLQDFEPDLLAKYPLLKGHQSRVENLKGIKEWIVRRPKTPF
jgi:glutathione S-transferase